MRSRLWPVLFRTLLFCLALLACSAAYGQPAEPLASFEVASVKPSAPPAPNSMMWMGCDGGPERKNPVRWTCNNMSLANLISMAYNLKRYQMRELGGYEGDRFDIAATLPEGTTPEMFRQMQQNLLKERFKLAVHFENKQVSGYELVVAKSGLKMKEGKPAKEIAADTPPPPTGPPPRDKDGFPVLPPGRYGMAMMNGKARWVAPEQTMEQIATVLGSQLNQPVVDATGLHGKYEVNLMWVSENMSSPMMAGADSAPTLASQPDGPTLIYAIQDQLGLKLQAKKVFIDVLIVDHIDKTPTEN
jgi:uncharacterized protein (TIGR03435 family)